MIPLEFFRWNFSFYSSFFLIREVKFVVVVVVVIVYCYMYRKISSYTKDVCDATRSNKIVEKRYTLHDSWRNAKRHVLSSLLKNERQNE